MDRLRPEAFLPLTPVAFEILLALAEGEQHGYSIMREVERRSAGAVTLHPGTLYRALARLLESGLIEELDQRPDPAHDDERRRYYRVTERGREVGRAEALRLESQLSAARTRLLGVRA
jgi:DNA-binding PadR family transcriptional regulator